MRMNDGLKGIPSEEEIYLKRIVVTHIDYDKCNKNSRLSQYNR